MGARLWISDQRPDDYRREVTQIYDALEKLFEMERNMLLIPLLIAVLAAIVALVAFPPSLARGGWLGGVGLSVGVLLGAFLLSWVVIRFCSRRAYHKVLGGLQQQAEHKRVQMIIKHLSHQDRALRPLVARYHLAEEREESGRRSFSVRLIPPKPGKG
jgi:hypothetical protein